MVTQAKAYVTPEEYLALERAAEYKSEYFAGEIFAMSGASREHNLINTNLGREFSNQLRRQPCEIYSSDMRVKVNPTGLYAYPDHSLVCGEPQFEDDHFDILINPSVIVEILSPSTEAYDRGEKFAHYRTIESLTDYLLVSQVKPRIEHYTRQENNQWLFKATEGLEGRVQIPSIEVHLLLSDVYERVTFPSEEKEE